MAASSPIITCTAPVNIAVIKYCKSLRTFLFLTLILLPLQGERETRL